MNLIERDESFAALQMQFDKLYKGTGHCILISGEAGIGKTSLVREFCSQQKNNCLIVNGTCDALFTPRPLAPLYDIILQLQSDLIKNNWQMTDRSWLFTHIFLELTEQKQPTVVVFEDIHWADEATLDFIKFLARRINNVPCLFILTYRDDEVHVTHSLRNVLGQLPSDTFTRLSLNPLSPMAVEKLAEEKGYNGENIFTITGGNPFYVNEILASYSPGVPDNIRDSILAVYHQQDVKTKHIWEILSVLPTGFEVKYLSTMSPLSGEAAKAGFDSKILIIKDEKIFFKHELYRMTIEAALSPLERINLNKQILDYFLPEFEKNQEIERIIHHATNAHVHLLVAHYAPLAAKKAACAGGHAEAAKLYLLAIEHIKDNDEHKILALYESYAYECYLINRHKEAINYTERALKLWKEQVNNEKTSECLCFLSRLWWFEGNRQQAENLGREAIDVLEDQPASKAKAMAYSNMAQLKMLEDQSEECMDWGLKASAIAREIDNQEILAQALNSMGSALMTLPLSIREGVALIQQSLKVAFKHAYHEHVARAYTALGSNAVTMKNYGFAKRALQTGIRYCEERDLDSLKLYMLGWKARLCLETGNWDEASNIANYLLQHENLLPVIKFGALTVTATIKLRKGDDTSLPLLVEAKNIAFETMELQRILPAVSAILEYEWISGNRCLGTEVLEQTLGMVKQIKKITRKSKFYYWLQKARPDYLRQVQWQVGHDEDTSSNAEYDEAAYWAEVGCPYEQALALFESSESSKREALHIMQELGATIVYEKLKREMRAGGVKSIPRGLRRTTRSNPAHLTGRELDVLYLLREGMQNKEIADKLFISAKTVDHHISAILTKLDVNSRGKAVQEAITLDILK